jgi:hypothetical protein
MAGKCICPSGTKTIIIISNQEKILNPEFMAHKSHALFL